MGDHMYVATRKQMQKIDEILLKTYSIEELVDKASDCLLEEVRHFDSFCVVCGGGNNGADGFSLAVKLHEIGKKVFVFACMKEHLSQAGEFYYRQCVLNHLVVDLPIFENCLETCDMCIDAIFGFGCHSNPMGIYQEMIQMMNQKAKYLLSIDVPSGLDCDTGIPYENCVRADQTITFFAMKRGFFHPMANEVTGNVLIKRLEVLDFSSEISIPEYVEDVVLRKRSYDGHKGIYGKSFLICGSDDYHGAALLSSKACVYTGCGITCLYANEPILQEASLYVPEAIHAHDLSKIKDYHAILIGCGLGSQEDLLRKVLFETNQPLIIDASSLNDLSKHLEWLEDNQRKIILTPHLGEFKRLCPNAKDPIVSAIEFAKKYHVIVVLKGPHTLITDGETSYCNSSGNGAMAIGGCGDVLAGMITSLVAQGYDALEAAKIGTYLHGVIGDEIARYAYSVLPSQIIDMIPQIMKKHS